MGETVNFCYNRCMMGFICLTGPVLGFAGYKIITDLSAYVIGIYVLWLSALAVVCSGGQKLKDESESLGDVLYNVDWSNLDTELQKDLMFVIMRSRKPIMLNAGPVGSMTYDMMVKIVKSSYSYLALLQTM